MTTKDELKRELTKLLVREQEILKRKAEFGREFLKLEEEEQTNRKRIAELRELIGRQNRTTKIE